MKRPQYWCKTGLCDHPWFERQRDKAARSVDRMSARRGRTARQQLAVLDDRLGKGVGAKRERARLLAAIAEMEASR